MDAYFLSSTVVQWHIHKTDSAVHWDKFSDCLPNIFGTLQKCRWLQFKWNDLVPFTCCTFI